MTTINCRQGDVIHIGERDKTNNTVSITFAPKSTVDFGFFCVLDIEMVEELIEVLQRRVEDNED